MTAVKRLKEALNEHGIDEATVSEIFKGYEKINDRQGKHEKAKFFKTAVERMDKILDPDKARAIRDSCACSKGGWRQKAMEKIAHDHKDKSIEEKLDAINQVTYMGKPVLNPDGTISASIGDKGGFECPCPVFSGLSFTEMVSITYCYCCAGHFRHHYQVALGKELETVSVDSSALASQRKEACRFIYRIKRHN